jgi:peptide/nickel transport system substrate-binding protein
MSEKSKRLSRREFLKVAGAAAGMATLAACQPAPTAAPTQPSAPTQAPAATATAVPPTATPKPAPTATPAPKGPKPGGKMTFAINQDPTNLLPFGAVATANHWGKEFMYDSLVEWNKDLIVQPALAEKWETPDEKTWIFYLKKGLKFHNGDEVTAEDVKYSFEMQANPPSPGVKIAQYPSIVSIEAVDKYTVKFNMKGPDPTMLGYMAWARYSPVVPNKAYDRWNLITTGVGTGPFKLVEYVPNDRVVYTKYADFWKKGLPYLDDLVLKILPDESAAVAALRSGAIDGLGYLTADTARTLKNDPNIVVLKGLFSAPNVLQFTIKGDGKPWNKKEVRQAINKAINRQEIIDKVYAGEAVLSGPIPPGYGDWFLPESELKEFMKQDVAAAKELMAKAGYKDGFKITLHSIAKPVEHVQTSEIIKEQLKAIGIEVEIVAEEITAFAKRVGDGNYDFCKTARGMRHDPTGYLVDFGRPDKVVSGAWFTADRTGWFNPEIADLYEKILVNLDSKSRHEQVKKIQELILDECPHIWLNQNYKFQAVRSYVKDMYVAFTDFNGGLREVWLDK